MIYLQKGGTAKERKAVREILKLLKLEGFNHSISISKMYFGDNEGLWEVSFNLNIEKKYIENLFSKCLFSEIAKIEENNFYLKIK